MGCFYLIAGWFKVFSMQIRILFIINPKSGSSTVRVDVPGLLQQLLNQDIYQSEIVYTEYAGHATELARQAAAENISVVCAVGGDGTVNEVAQGLTHTHTALAILPRGSGNGLARHLGIPMQIPAAIEILNQNHRYAIDSCSINERPFFCTAGIGFDAQISSIFAASLKRGLTTYVRLVLQEFIKFKPQPIVLQLNGESLDTTCFVVAFANASQYGNNAYIAPMADIRDGLLDVCLIRHLNLNKAIALGYGLITKNIATSGDAQYFTTTDISVSTPTPIKYHADGEYMGEASEFKVTIAPLSLQVIAPEAHLQEIKTNEY
jgi:diacylglycerol kinase (ATP)